MNYLEKLLAVISLGQIVQSKRLVQNNLAGIVRLAGLAIIVSIMIAASILASFYVGYLVLLSCGIAPLIATIIIYFLLVLTTVILVILIVSYVRKMRKLKQNLSEQPPIAKYAMSVVDSFIDGFRDR